jgi:hypothetical protein
MAPPPPPSHLTLARCFPLGLRVHSMMLNTSPFVASVICGGMPPLPKMSPWHDEVWPKCYGRNLFHCPCFMKLFCRGLACFWEMIEQRFPTFIPWRNLNHCIWKHLQAIKNWWQGACLSPLVWQLFASNEVNTQIVQIDQNREAVISVQRLLNIGNC